MSLTKEQILDLPKPVRRVYLAVKRSQIAVPEHIAADLGLKVDTVRRHLASLVTRGLLASRTVWSVVP